ncbi:MAG: L-threonylcarbamoyladenylate synthase [Enterobacterales bacterium]|jgi:L-threonylcarbamoyladenylate synthase
MSLALSNIEQAVKSLHRGGIIAYPTESVFGLGCDPNNLQAVQNLLDIKSRPSAKGLIIIASDIEQLSPWVDFGLVPNLQDIKSSWPGPETWLIPCNNDVSKLLRGNHTTLAVRVSAHPVVQQLCQQFGGAIISTSANKNGETAEDDLLSLQLLFSEQIDCYVKGDVSGNDRPSRIRDALSGKLIRA